MEETRICICGCGEEFKCWYNHKRRYINGHQNKGKKHTQEVKDRMSKAHIGLPSPNKGKLGKKCIQETKDKISKALKGRPSTLKGKTISQKIKDKISITLKGKKHTQETKEKMTKWTKEAIEIAFKSVPNIRQAEWDKLAKLGLLPCAGTVRKQFSSFENLEEITNKKFLFRKKRKWNVGNNESFILDYKAKEIGHTIERQVHIKTVNGNRFADGGVLQTKTLYEVYEPNHKYQKEHDEGRIKTMLDNSQYEKIVILWEQDELRRIKEIEEDGILTKQTTVEAFVE